MSWSLVAENSKWIFSGIGVPVIVGIFGYLFYKKKKSMASETYQHIESGDESTNIQGRDHLNIHIGDKHEK